MSFIRDCVKGLGLFSLVIVLSLILSSPHARGELADAGEMNLVCENWLSQIVFLKGTWAGVTEPEIIRVDELFSGDTLLARIYGIAPRGFVVVPVLKEMTPVKAYSDESNLDADQEDGFLQLLRDVLSSRMSLYAERFGSLEAVQSIDDFAVFGRGQKQLWDKYAVGTDEFSAKTNSLQSLAVTDAGPLLTSSWHQRAPYNNLCPMGDGGLTVVGCVATAVAQIMKFWQWPVEGNGSYSYYWPGDNSCGSSTPGEILSADFSDPYSWAYIPDNCDGGCSPIEENALAELNYEVGVACDMDYGACGSGSYASAALKAFVTYFKYNAGASLVSRYQYSLVDWYNLVKEQIDNGQPTDYFISRHSIICDGYRQVGDQYQYHMNYGWTNSAFNTWYILDSLYCYWEPDSLCPAEQDHMIIDIKPQTEPILSCVNMTVTENPYENGHISPGETGIELEVSIQNYGFEAENAVGTLSSTDPYISIITSGTTFDPFIPWGGFSTCQSPFVFDVGSSCPDPHLALLKLTVNADGGYVSEDSIYIFIGDTPGLADDFESGENFWTHRSQTLTYNDEWHMENYRSHSSTNSWKAGGWGSDFYSDNLDAALISPPFLLPDYAELKFWHWIDAEIGTGSEAWDGGILMISTGDGQWTQITPEGGYPYEIVDNPASPFEPGTPCFSGAYDWSEVTVDLSAYSGVVQLMFRFGTDGYVTREGWYVDDIEVISAGCCVGYTGNTNCSEEEIPDIADITRLIDYLYLSHTALCCLEEGDVNKSGGEPDIADITKLIDHLYLAHPPLPDCP
ncbi:MAG: C10 family peptidase [candidate division Zixibacteria bacterium]|nr:C10 family peptidase [candidate division Zixibacteria bacterium]